MNKNILIRIIVSGLMLFTGMLAEHNIIPVYAFGDAISADNVLLIWFLAGYLIIGGSVIKEAASNILSGEVFDENFLMTVASIGAFIVGEFPEALAVMLFYQIGEMFQSYAVNKSRKSIAELMDIKPELAYIKQNDGKLVKARPEEVKIGQIIVVKPGEKIPLDGIVANGEATLDTSALTGESLPTGVSKGMEVISGSININGVLEIEVKKEYGESTVAKILELVENAGNKKAETEKFITKFARYYTPIVVGLAVLLAIVPPVVLGILVEGGIRAELFSDWIYRALSFLVTSCPCALVISVPLSFFGGIGGASSKGVLVKGSNYLEILAKCDTVVFDKTGTLTKGNFRVQKLVPCAETDENELLYTAVLAEYYSNHPISESLEAELARIDAKKLSQIDELASGGKLADGYKELAGYGIKARINEDMLYVGNRLLMENANIEAPAVTELGTIVYVARNEKYLGYIVIADEVKEQSKPAIKMLYENGVKRTVMLTGDKKQIGEHIGCELGIDKIYTELLPADKVGHLEKLLSEKNEGKVAFVGDGINDAPVLARADVGIAMGALGSDAAIEAADIVIMDDNPEGIAKAIRIAKKTVKIVKQNIVFALGVKIVILLLAALGIANMWAAVFADVGVSVIAIINALRTIR